MTFVGSAPVPAARVVTAVGDPARPELDRLLAAEPMVNAVLIARLASARSLAPGVLGGPVLGVRRSGELAAAAFHGGNLLPTAPDPADAVPLAARLADTTRLCTSVVGRADVVGAMWPLLEPSWGSPRAVREEQPVLVRTRATPCAVRPHPGVRPMQRRDLQRYLPAAAAMFTEELGVSPFRGAHGASYERRVDGLIAAGRAFGLLDADGRIAFKADLPVLTRETCQVQGVWVRPDLRGQGIGTRALAAVFAHALRLAPTVSLYVNDFNVAARRMYARLGMTQIATLSTVLL